MSNHQLFQYSVLDEFVNKQDENLIKQRWEKFQNFLSKQEYIENVKEEKYQDGFLKDIFEECLGYTLDSTNPNSYNLEREKKNKIDGKKADGAIVIDNHVVGIIELKGQNTKELDKKGSREQSTVDQAFGYLYSHDSKYAKYVIVSNFNEVRFYIKDKTDYERFFLFQMKYEEFKKFHTILSYESIKAQIPLQIKEKSVTFEVDISNKFYKDYTKFRTELFENIIKNNPNKDQYNLLNATQKLIDRIVFILFGEDTGLLPLNTIPTIIKEYKEQRLTDYSLYDVYKIYFQAIDKGNSRLEIDRYNGGLFASDDYLDSLIIDSEVLDTQAKILSAYKFGNDISVNILGHIFEQSISDLEEITAQIENKSFDKRESKRKKDGVFYTPAYITKYIVDNTLGKLCEEKKKELDIIDIEIKKGTRAITKDKINKNLESYKEWLLSLKILDPACGSGAFLNQALEFLIEEHNQLQREFAKLGNILFTYEVEKSILENNLYGVDINTGAVEIAKLSLWLRTASRGRSLTSLADKIKVGNSLIDDKSVVDNAFVWEEEFSEVFEQGGFDVVIGNPPYVQLQSIKKISKQLENQNYKTFEKTGDLYVLFYELGNKLLRENGLLGYITSNKWLRAKYGKKLRGYLSKESNPKVLMDLGSGIFESATVDSNILITEKSIKEQCNLLALDLSKEKEFLGFESYISKGVNITDCSDEIWTISSPLEQSIKTKIEKIGIALKDWDVDINYGIKTGLTDAFIISEDMKNELIKKDIKNENLIKPVLRGRDIKRYSIDYQNLYLINIHNGYENVQRINIDDYPSIKEYLEKFEPKLTKRSDKGDTPYNLRNCAYIDDFKKDKIIYPDINSKLSFVLDNNSYFMTNTAYFLNIDSKYVLSVLNSSTIQYYFSTISAQLGESGLRHFTIYIEKLPIPKISETEQEPFIDKANRILEFNKSFQSKKNKFLKRVNSNFELEKLSKKLKAFYEYDFKTFVKELKKKKVTLTLIQQDEWEEYFEAYQKELLNLQAQIDATDREIDQMVYKLYGLTEDEVALVEGR